MWDVSYYAAISETIIKTLTVVNAVQRSKGQFSTQHVCKIVCNKRTAIKAKLFKSTLCLKKIPTFELSVTLSNLNRFSNCLHCWKAYEICYNTHTTLPTSP